MDIQAMQSMDWLFKKERIYLLAQFWQQRATLAEKEVSALKEQLATANQNLTLAESKAGSGGSIGSGSKPSEMEQQTLDIITRSTLEIELAAKEKEISQLVEDVQRLQSSITKLQECSAGKIARLEEQLEHKRQHIARLEARLDSQRDYEDLKRELSILRSLEFPALGADNSSKSLEMLILERTKAFQQAECSAIKASSSITDSQDPVQTTPSTPNPPTPQHSTSEADNKSIEQPTSPSTISSPVNTSPGFATTSSPTGSMVCTTPAITSPLPATVLPTSLSVSASGDSLSGHHHHHHQLINGSPKTPPEDSLSSSVLCSNNNNTQLNNNNINSQVLTSCISGNGLSITSSACNVTVPPPTSTPISNSVAFFRTDESLKSPFRFDDPRSPFRFADESGPMTPGGVMVGRLGDSLIPKGDPMEARLQEMLRYNMDKYSSQNLDTLHISRRVRELLSINNIGQRLFAKYVLGLSQGTVSELLSKPKPWDKLTEKGRDSYRKMHAWACDENAVMLLKSLIPKKETQSCHVARLCDGGNGLSTGKDTGIPTFGRGDPDNMTEERIAHILNEASQMMKTQVEDSHSNDSKSPNHAQDGSQNRRLKKYENDDIPQEKVVRIYQEELAKLMGRRMEDTIRGREHFPSLLFPHFFSPSGGPQIDRTQEEIRMALDAYHRELAKLNSVSSCPVGSPANMSGLPGLLALQQQALNQHHHQQQHAQLNGIAQDLSLPKDRKDSMGKVINGSCNEIISEEGRKDGTPGTESIADVLRHAGSAFSLVRPKTEPGIVHQSQTSTGSSASSPLSNSILPPAMTPGEDFVGSAAASPLQRMASITNSLISQPSTPTHHSPSQRPLKAVLPPITQQQFDMFNNLNTEDIVKKVKESLSQYSISQRLFGESVLGLSQGSVSDLLARPKPWHMLTQKGREPFIRMKMFLEDENAVHKLVASQYKIAPEKLMRTGNYAGGPPCQPLSKPPATKLQSDINANKSLSCDTQNSILPPSVSALMASHPPQPSTLPQPPPPSLLNNPSHHALSSLTTDTKKCSQGASHHNLHSHHHHHQQQQQQPISLRALQQHVTPSVYEMAALTQDLDTQTITTKIKEALLANNIGQKIFGEAVLGLSQGSVSELLSKPKPWHMLSIKGREPFIRMQLWLNDAHNIERLQALKNERREANKRRRSSGHGHHGGGGGADNSSDTSSNDTSEFYHSPSPGPGPPSAKKQRVLFTEEQKEALRLAFALDSYPSVATIEFLGAELALSSRTITNWFHNHRMRLKQQVPHGLSPENTGMPPVNRESSGMQPTFDPVQFRLLLNQRLLELQKERMGLGSVPLPYPPYFAPNNNFAALLGRGILPTSDCDLSRALGNVVNASKEQYSGLDLSMGSIKREPDFEDDEDVESNIGSEDSNISSSSLRDTSVKKESESVTVLSQVIGGGGRTSRRKPAAPQWVNPEWQESSGVADEGKDKCSDKEVIINGVCVMQTDDYDIKLEKDEETVRVEPTPVLDRYEDDDEDPCSDASSDGENRISNSNENLHQRRSSDDAEADEERLSTKSDGASSPIDRTEINEGEGNDNDEETQVGESDEVRHSKYMKQDSELKRFSDDERRENKDDWHISSNKKERKVSDTLDKLQKRIKPTEQDDRWEY